MSSRRIPLAGCLRVTGRELRSTLCTPASYGVAAAFLALTGVVFYAVADTSREASLRFWFPNLAFVLLVTAPIATSRLVAEDWRTGRLDGLLARPVTAAGVIVGKWLSASAFFVVLLVPTLAYVAFLEAWGRPDYPPLIGSYLGAVLLAAMFCAVGTMTSSLTPTAVAAGLASFALLVLSQLADNIAPLRSLSFQGHLEAFSRGAPGLSDALFFVSVTGTCLVVATARQVARLRLLDRARAMLVPAAALVVAVGVNWVPLPAEARVDLTATGRFTLSGATRDVLRNVKESARVTVFEVAGSPEAGDANVLLTQFRRTSPRIKIRVLDVARFAGEALRLGVEDDGQVVVEYGGRREVSGPPATEQGITSALQRLARGVPQLVCSLAGHGERELDDPSPSGWAAARRVMEANGIDTRRLDLTVAANVPTACTILVVPAPTSALLDSEIRAINDFAAADGRVMVLREPGGPDLDGITLPYGLRFLPGVVVDPERSVAGDPTTLLVNRFPSDSPVNRDVAGVLMVGAGGLAPARKDGDGLTVTRIAESSAPSWLEQDQEVAHYDAEAGDVVGPVALVGTSDRSAVRERGETRVPGDGPSITRTRLAVFAEADWASNAFLAELGNRTLLANTLNWLAGEDDLVAVGGEQPDLRRLMLTSDRRSTLGWVVIPGLPAVPVLAGVALWFRRRRR